MGTLLIAPFLAFAPMAAAQGSNSGSGASSGTGSTAASNSDSGASSNSATTDNMSKTELETKIEKEFVTEGKKLTQADRLKARVAELKIKLTLAEQTKIKAKCVAAQANVKTLESRVDAGLPTRGKAYAELLDHLDKLIVKLKAANVDTAELEKERAALKGKIDTFSSDLAKYKLALDDLKVLGCVADPSAFKATLEAARTSRATVASDAAAIRSYVNDTVKPTLKTLKAEVDKSTSEDSSTDDSKAKTTTTGGTQ